MEPTTRRTRPTPKLLLLAGLAALVLGAACVPFAPPPPSGSASAPPPGCAASSTATATGDDPPLNPAAAAVEATTAYQAEAETPIDPVPLVTVEMTPQGPNIETHPVDSVAEAAAVGATEAVGNDLVSVESDELASTTASNDPYRYWQWPLNRTTYEAAWSISRGTGVTVAVVDTGVDRSHPDLSGQVLSGWTFLNGTQSKSGAADDNGHGTHVAGTIAARANNQVGITGAAPGARILPVKVLSASGSGYYSDVAKGITWATQHGARVINLSLGGSSTSSAITSAIDYARSCKAVVVAAAGNNGSCAGTTNAPSYPAAISGALGVAAVDSTLTRACFSNVGTYVDFAAPGVGVWSTLPGAKYASWQGTSMATPHVAAAAAIVLAKRPGCGAKGVADRLRLSAYKLPSVKTYVGVGLVDPLKALKVSGC
jgi:subtilisin family serine protease